MRIINPSPNLRLHFCQFAPRAGSPRLGTIKETGACAVRVGVDHRRAAGVMVQREAGARRRGLIHRGVGGGGGVGVLWVLREWRCVVAGVVAVGASSAWGVLRGCC